MERSEAGFIPNSRFDRIESCTNSVVITSNSSLNFDDVSLIEELIDLCDEYHENTNEFIFHMKPGNFPTILHYYLGASKLHFSDGTCPIKFIQVRFPVFFYIAELYFVSGTKILGHFQLVLGDLLYEEVLGYSGSSPAHWEMLNIEY